jgi:type III secretion protein V
MSLINRLLAEMSKRQDLVFAFFFVMIVVMLVFPLPTWLVDGLLAVNLTVSLVILISATYLKHPLEMSSFPSIILLTSMLRVAMSVATTRLILATGDAGQLIVAFGEFVIGGNLVVGLVIFLIIATVQFMVVTKGAERISEVSARFTLDALPGKQMSIDNDARNGDITAEEARDKRQTLQLEMQFYGAMDGAMRFVKGDAIAGLIIVFINLVGGMTIGMMQRGLSAGEAGQLYVLLSVGDGLIAQIPAMFMALAAGTIVTRVTTDTSSNLGRDITRQLGAEPKALGVAGFVAIGMGFTPGFPTIVFMILGGTLCYVAWRMGRDPTEAKAPTGQDTGAPPAPETGEGAPPPADTPPSALPEGAPEDQPMDPIYDSSLPLRPAQQGDIIVVGANPATLALLCPDSTYRYVEKEKESFLRRIGFSAPPIGYQYEHKFNNGEFSITIDNVPSSKWLLRDVFPPTPLNQDQARTFAIQIGTIRTRHAAQLFGVPEAQQWLEDIQPAVGRMANDIQQLMPLLNMVETLRRLLAEQIGLTPPRLVLEGLVQATQRAKEPDGYAEVVRTFLQRQISHSVADESKTIAGMVLGPDCETNFRRMLNPDPQGGPPPGKDFVESFIAHVKERIPVIAEEAPNAIFIVPPDIRRPFIQMLRNHDIFIRAIGYNDIASGYQVRTVEVLTFEKQQAA